MGSPYAIPGHVLISPHGELEHVVGSQAACRLHRSTERKIVVFRLKRGGKNLRHKS